MEHTYAHDKPATKPKRITKMCCVPQCSNKADTPVSFHKFPTDRKKRKVWETALRMGKPASDHVVVCGEHFKPSDFFPGASQKILKLLKKNVVPSEKIPIRSHDKVENREVQDKTQRRLERTAKRSAHKEVKSTNKVNACEDQLEEEEPTKSENENEIHGEENPPPQSGGTSDTSTQTDAVVSCKCLTRKPKSITIIDMVTDVKKLKNLTGLYSFELLDALEICLQDLTPDGKKKEMCLRSRIILCFVKLKLNLNFTSLANLCGIAPQTCSKYFKETICLLRTVLETMIPWPDHETIRQNIPIAFKNYRDTRIVLDCAETPIEKSKCLKCRILTWSNYKGKQTAKFDVGVTPSGLITHLSQCYGGRASDKFIVNQSGILDKLTFRDACMTDKGYRIEEECLQRNLILYRPPFVYQKKQMSRADAMQCAEIARARVHVERVIQRLREFKFMCDPVPWELLPWFDDALITVAGIVNLGPPVLNIDKFM